MTRIPKSRSEVFPHPRPHTPDALWPAPRLGIRGLRNCVSRSWTLKSPRRHGRGQSARLASRRRHRVVAEAS